MSSLYVTICRCQSVTLPCNRPFYCSSLRPTYVLSRHISSVLRSFRPLTILPFDHSPSLTHRPTALLAYSHTILYNRSAFARPYHRPHALTSLRPIVSESVHSFVLCTVRLTVLQSFIHACSCTS